MKTILFIILILFSKFSVGQFADRINNYCKNNQFYKLINLVDSLNKTGGTIEKGYNANEEISRQIIGNYYETILNYRESKTIFIDYTINLISDSNKIIYCKIFSALFPDTTEIFFDSLVENKFSTLQNLYFKTYGNKINIKDFFVDTVIYGTYCDRGAIPPVYRQLCEKAIDEKDISLLNSWLTSVTTEKQMYAIEALSRLENKGFTLTLKQKNFINIIKNKKGTVRCCMGCLQDSLLIQDALKLSKK